MFSEYLPMGFTTFKGYYEIGTFQFRCIMIPKSYLMIRIIQWLFATDGRLDAFEWYSQTNRSARQAMYILENSRSSFLFLKRLWTKYTKFGILLTEQPAYPIINPVQGDVIINK